MDSRLSRGMTRGVGGNDGSTGEGISGLRTPWKSYRILHAALNPNVSSRTRGSISGLNTEPFGTGRKRSKWIPAYGAGNDVRASKGAWKVTMEIQKRYSRFMPLHNHQKRRQQPAIKLPAPHKGWRQRGNGRTAADKDCHSGAHPVPPDTSATPLRLTRLPEKGLGCQPKGGKTGPGPLDLPAALIFVIP